MALALSLSMAEEEQGSKPPINITGSAPTEAPAVVVD